MNKLLSVGVQQGASDIHFKVGDPPSYRVNGVLHNLKSDKLTPALTRDVCLNLIQDPSVRQSIDVLQEHDTSYALTGVARFRVNVYRQRGTLSAILRIIPRDIPTVQGLSLPKSVLSFASMERGLVLVTGATGSGKSSTLAALINQINQTRRVHILTIEDPIEFLHPNAKASISQREIGIDTGSFGTALRSALRQDPDVLLIGEMRDATTIDIALKAAETGHMVFSTVHTTDAAKTVNRLISVFPGHEQATVRARLSDSLKGTISQRLLPRADRKGRVAACEIMIASDRIREYIRDSDKTASIKEVLEKGGKDSGMQSFDQHLTSLFKRKILTLETAKGAATNPSDFERALRFS